MTTRYQKSHYEDVAKVLKSALDRRPREFPRLSGMLAAIPLIDDFADLFAVDNPDVCCNWPLKTNGLCGLPCPCGAHHPRDGFDREQFLVACGLRDK